MPFYDYSEQILPNLCKGVARSKVFFNPARLRSVYPDVSGRDSWDYCRGFLVSLTCVDLYRPGTPPLKPIKGSLKAVFNGSLYGL